MAALLALLGKYLTILCFFPRVILAQEVSPDPVVQLVKQAPRYSTMPSCLSRCCSSLLSPLLLGALKPRGAQRVSLQQGLLEGTPTARHVCWLLARLSYPSRGRLLQKAMFLMSLTSSSQKGNSRQNCMKSLCSSYRGPLAHQEILA